MQLTYNETIDILDLKYIRTKRIGYSLTPGIYEVVDLNNTLKHILPDNLKLTITIDDIRLKSNLKSNQALIFTEKSFFLYIFRFEQITFLSFERYRWILSIDCGIVKKWQTY